MSYLSLTAFTSLTLLVANDDQSMMKLMTKMITIVMMMILQNLASYKLLKKDYPSNVFKFEKTLTRVGDHPGPSFSLSLGGPNSSPKVDSWWNNWEYHFTVLLGLT